MSKATMALAAPLVAGHCSAGRSKVPTTAVWRDQRHLSFRVGGAPSAACFRHKPHPGFFADPIESSRGRVSSAAGPHVAVSAPPNWSWAPVIASTLEGLPLPRIGLYALSSAIEIALTLFIANAIKEALTRWAHRAEEMAVHQVETHRNTPARFSMLATEATLLAVYDPAVIILPIVAYLHSARIVIFSLEYLLSHPEAVHHSAAGLCANNLVEITRNVEIFLQDSIGIGFLVVGIWAFLRWKDRLIKWLIELEETNETLDRMLVPLNSLTTWLTLATGLLGGLNMCGINIQPLLTVGGVSGIVIGFGAQNIISNALSGVNLFISQPFMVGDRVTLMTGGGGKVVTGVVEKIDPMRTLIRDDGGVAVTIPNKAINDMLVANESLPKREKLSGRALRGPRPSTATPPNAAPA